MFFASICAAASSDFDFSDAAPSNAAGDTGVGTTNGVGLGIFPEGDGAAGDGRKGVQCRVTGYVRSACAVVSVRVRDKDVLDEARETLIYHERDQQPSARMLDYDARNLRGTVVRQALWGPQSQGAVKRYVIDALADLFRPRRSHFRPPASRCRRRTARSPRGVNGRAGRRTKHIHMRVRAGRIVTS